MAQTPSSASFHIDVDDICNSLHVDRGTFIAATKRSQREKNQQQQQQNQSEIESMQETSTPASAGVATTTSHTQKSSVTPDVNNASLSSRHSVPFPTSPSNNNGGDRPTNISYGSITNQNASNLNTPPSTGGSSGLHPQHVAPNIFSKAIPIPSALKGNTSGMGERRRSGGNLTLTRSNSKSALSDGEPLLGGGGVSASSQSRFGISSLVSDHAPKIKQISARTGLSSGAGNQGGSFRLGDNNSNFNTSQTVTFAENNPFIVPSSDIADQQQHPSSANDPNVFHFMPQQSDTPTMNQQRTLNMSSSSPHISSKLGDSPAIKPRTSPGGLPSTSGLSHDNLQGLLLPNSSVSARGGSEEPRSPSQLMNSSGNTDGNNNNNRADNSNQELTITQDSKGELTMGFLTKSGEEDVSSTTSEDDDRTSSDSTDRDGNFSDNDEDERSNSNSNNPNTLRDSRNSGGAGMGPRSATPNSCGTSGGIKNIDGKMIMSTTSGSLPPKNSNSSRLGSAPKFTLPPVDTKEYLDEDKIRQQQEILNDNNNDDDNQHPNANTADSVNDNNDKNINSENNMNNNNLQQQQQQQQQRHHQIYNDKVEYIQDDGHTPPHPVSAYNPRAIDTQNVRSALQKSPGSKLRKNSSTKPSKTKSNSNLNDNGDAASTFSAPQGSTSNFTTGSSRQGGHHHQGGHSGSNKRKSKKHVRFSEDVIEHVKVEQSDVGGVIVKVSFKRPPWLFWILSFALLTGVAGWFILLTQAHRAAEDDRPHAVWKLASIRSWSTTVTVLLMCVFAFPPKSTDFVFARDCSNILRLLFTALLFCSNKILVYLALSVQLTIAPLLIHGTLPMFFVVGTRYFLALCGLSSANTTWYDKLSAVAALVGAVTIPINYGYSKDAAFALLFGAISALCVGSFTWKRKSIRPYFSQGVVAVTASVLTSLCLSVPLFIESVRECHIPAVLSNSSSPAPTPSPSATTTTTTFTTTTMMATPSPPFSPQAAPRSVVVFNMDSDAFVLTLLAGICEALNLFGMGLILGFLDVPAKLAFGGLAVPLYMIFFAITPNIPELHLGMSLAVAIVTSVTVAIQIYFGESHRRETHLHLNTNMMKNMMNNNNGGGNLPPGSAPMGFGGDGGENGDGTDNNNNHNQKAKNIGTPYPVGGPQFPDMIDDDDGIPVGDDDDTTADHHQGGNANSNGDANNMQQGSRSTTKSSIQSYEQIDSRGSVSSQTRRSYENINSRDSQQLLTVNSCKKRAHFRKNSLKGRQAMDQ